MMMSTCHGVAFEFGKILGNHTEFMEVDYISLKVLFPVSLFIEFVSRNLKKTESPYKWTPPYK